MLGGREQGGRPRPNGTDSYFPTSSTSPASPTLAHPSYPSITTNGQRHPHEDIMGDLSASGRADRPTREEQFYGHDRVELVRLIIQALHGLGFHTVAGHLSEQSGYDLESPTATAFRTHILDGSWRDAEQLLDGALSPDAPTGGHGNGLILCPGSSRNKMKFWIRRQKYMELLERMEHSRALAVLRQELTPLCPDTQTHDFLSTLLGAQSADDLKSKASWDGAEGSSRRVLLSELSKRMSPSVMLPENRLAVLLQQQKQFQIQSCVYHTSEPSLSLYSDHQCAEADFPSDVALVVSDMQGEVWQIKFSHDGTLLAASGAGGHVVVWSVPSFRVVFKLGTHEHGVGNIAWSPDDSHLVTCGRDNYGRIFGTRTGLLVKQLGRFDENVTGCVWAADSKSFVLASLDKTRGLRTYSSGGDLVYEWSKNHRVQDICGSPNGSCLVAADENTTIYVYDWTTRRLDYTLQLDTTPTSMSISKDSKRLFVNQRDGPALLYDFESKALIQKFVGHTIGAYVIRGSFGGANESFVVSGSEDGNILVWHVATNTVVKCLKGHDTRCNSASWSPTDHGMLASCGDDGRIKIWTSKGRTDQISELHRTEMESQGSG